MVKKKSLSLFKRFYLEQTENIQPLLGKHTKICNNPFLIGMWTTMEDFSEFVFVLFDAAEEYG